MAFGLGEMFLLYLLSQGKKEPPPGGSGIPAGKAPGPRVVDETPPGDFPSKAPPASGKKIPPPPSSGNVPPGAVPPAAEKPAAIDTPFPSKVPASYRPPGGWVPYVTGWSVATAKSLLPTLMPGNSIEKVEPGTGIVVRFRGETGAQHGNPNITRAVTAWKMKYHVPLK